MTDDISLDLTGLTVELLSAFVANNNVRSEDLPTLITSTHAALAGLSESPREPELAVPAPEAVHEPAITARKSLANRDVILSMIDGKPYKTLKRHLAGHGLTPDSYRARYNLPATYPMVAPGYSEARSESAKRLGLGRKPRAPEAPEASEAAAVAPPAKRARKPRAAKQPAEG